MYAAELLLPIRELALTTEAFSAGSHAVYEQVRLHQIENFEVCVTHKAGQ